MKEKYIQSFSIMMTVACGMLIAWIYWAAPRNLEEVSFKASETIESVTNRTQVVIGTYKVNQEKFNEGLQNFRQDNFVLARDLFGRADPEARDARTQFYISYSFYRQGWGRISNDDELFTQGLEQINRVIALNRDYKSDDEDLQIKTPVELKNELEEGLRITAGDFNPFKVLGTRK